VKGLKQDVLQSLRDKRQKPIDTSARRRPSRMPKNYQQDFGSILTSKTSFIDEIINLARKSSIFYLLFAWPAAGSS